MNIRGVRAQQIGFGLVLLGALWLAVQLLNWNVGWLVWPFFILLPGVACLLIAALGSASLSGFFIPGGAITAVGGILFVQNLTGRFESWAYAWALIPAAVGVGLSLQGQRLGDEAAVRRGRWLAGVFGLVFVVALGFFEGLIFGDGAGTWFFRFALPLALIAVGVGLLLRRSGPGSR